MKQVLKKSISDNNQNVISKDLIYTLIVDGNSLLKISLVNKEVGSNGKEYGGVLQFFYKMRDMMNKKDWNYVYVFWDGDNSGQLRYDIYPEYKSNRDKHYRDKVSDQSDYDKALDEYYKRALAYFKNKKKKPVKRNETDDESFQRQRMIVQTILENLFVRQLICDDVEGDDLIAYYVKNMQEDERVIIFSGDRDITQLISDHVAMYIPQLKKFVSNKNHIELIGYTHENVLTKKIFCGDASDAIKGIKGVGDKTFFTLFPEAKTTKMTVDDVVNRAKELLDERKEQKKKPLQSLTNIVNKVTDGCQGDLIYEINKKIIDLSEPLLTPEAKEEMDNIMYAPMDPDGRDMAQLYQIIRENGMTRIGYEKSFGDLFGCYEGLIQREKKFFQS